MESPNDWPAVYKLLSTYTNSQLAEEMARYASHSVRHQVSASILEERRKSEIMSIPNTAPNPSPNKPNRIYDIGVGTFVVILGACAIWAIAYYFGIHL